jgi:hypothetical protein
MSMKKFLGRLAIVGALLGPAASLADAAPQFTPWGRVTTLQGGWVVDRMLVFHGTGALTNPDSCPLVTNGYIIKETDPGHRTFYAMLLSALLNQREVAMVISGCFEQRPRVVSVAIR